MTILWYYFSMKRIKLSDWARQNGVSWRTAYRYWKNGQLNGEQLPTGTILINVPSEETTERRTVVYARVSNSTRRTTDLVKQAERLVDYSIANGWKVDQVIKEVGSGLNDKRPKLMQLLEQENLGRIVIEHKDRLTRFGYNYLELYAKTKNIEIIIVNPSVDDEEELISDFVSIITSYCARLYGQRRGKRKTEIITKELNNATN